MIIIKMDIDLNIVSLSDAFIPSDTYNNHFPYMLVFPLGVEHFN